MFDATAIRPLAWLLALAVMATTPVAAIAGGPGDPGSGKTKPDEEMATVRVTLPSGGGSPTVALIRRHGPDSSPMKADASWFGVCLADRKQLEVWRKENPRRPERRLWDRALREKGYEALVHISRYSGAPRPSCYGVADAMSMRYTDVHPGYRSYVKMALTGTLPKRISRIPSGPPLLD